MKFLSLSTYFLLACFSFSSCLQMRVADQKILQVYEADPNLRGEIGYFQSSQGYKLRYLEAGNPDAEFLLLCIHGAPSSLSPFDRMFFRDPILQKNALLLALDRPGYGYSQFGKAEVSIAKQAEAIAELLTQPAYQNKRLAIMGSSYGGSVTARLGMLPELNVEKLFLCSASLAPGQEKIFGISHLMTWKATGWLFPKPLRVANIEKFTHYEALKEIEPDWHKITADVHILHGTADGLIWPENAVFAERKLVNAASVQMQWFEGVGHRVIWDYPLVLLYQFQSWVTGEPSQEEFRAYQAWEDGED